MSVERLPVVVVTQSCSAFLVTAQGLEAVLSRMASDIMNERIVVGTGSGRTFSHRLLHTGRDVRQKLYQAISHFFVSRITWHGCCCKMTAASIKLSPLCLPFNAQIRHINAKLGALSC